MAREKIMTFFYKSIGTLSRCSSGPCFLIWSDPQLELALRSHRYAGCLPPWQGIPAGDILPAGRPIDCSEYLGFYLKSRRAG